MNDEFENALAWFYAAPNRWLESAKKDLSAAADWIMGVIQGDFNDNASTAQVATGTVISMIPLVDQICDVRDMVANCKKINSEPNEPWHWTALVLTLIGLFPALGSLVKGCGKVMFASVRKAGHTTGAVPQIGKYINASIEPLNNFLNRSEVQKTLQALKIDNPYKYLASKFQDLGTKLNASKLLSAFDEAKAAAESMLNLAKKFGSSGVANKIANVIEVIGGVRRSADKMLARAVKPAQDVLDQIARRLNVEADMAHRAHLNTVNPHGYARMSLSAEKEAFDHAKPRWVDDTDAIKFDYITDPADASAGWTSTRPDPKRGQHPLDDAHTTFHTMEAKIIPPGTPIYRILDPKSSDNSICWMSKSEFESLKNKDDWRRRFAVWANWNSNGEYVVYIVPPGKGLHVWEGIAASQKMESTKYVLEGGARQIVVNPADLKKALVSERRATNWEYNELEFSSDLVGVPILKNNWTEGK
jgi:vacuolar-type H+-ATPase subunit E/Vma4